MKKPIGLILFMLCSMAQAVCLGADQPPNVEEWVRQIETGNVKEIDRSVYDFRSTVADKTRQRLHDFVAGMFARKQPLSEDDEVRLHVAIELLGGIGGHHDSLMLAKHLRWQVKGTVRLGLPKPPYEEFVCVRAMMRIGAISLPVFAEVLASSDDEVEVNLARWGIHGIGNTAMFTETYADLQRSALTFAKSYLEAAATLRKDPKEIERLQKSAAFFAQRLKSLK